MKLEKIIVIIFILAVLFTMPVQQRLKCDNTVCRVTKHNILGITRNKQVFNTENLKKFTSYKPYPGAHARRRHYRYRYVMAELKNGEKTEIFKFSRLFCSNTENIVQGLNSALEKKPVNIDVKKGIFCY